MQKRINLTPSTVIDRLEALGCDPIEGMARIAMDEEADLSLRTQMYKELAQYVAPKRKAVEMKTEGEISLVDVIRSIDQRKDQAQTAQSRQPVRGRIGSCIRTGR